MRRPATIDGIIARSVPQPSCLSPRNPSSSPRISSGAAMKDSTPSHVSSPVRQKNNLALSNLMSPPEPLPYDSFSLSPVSSSTQCHKSSKSRTPANVPLSPPVSPFARPSNSIAPIPTTDGPNSDPILYPNHHDVPALSSPQPLFHQADRSEASSSDAGSVVDGHMAARPATFFRHADPPRREDYELALYFKSAVMKQYAQDRKGWCRREREQLLADRKASMARRQRLHPILPVSKSGKISRPAPSKAKKTSSPRTIAARAPKSTPADVSAIPVSPPVSSRPDIRVGQSTVRPPVSRRIPSSTPEPRARPVAPNREDKDYASLNDYCPPLSSLPNRPNSLKVDWKGNPLDLSQDPHRHMLHLDEVALAAGLRLDCATYLTSKRRIFCRRLECARIGKEFRKTDAQQACKIDVNKASKLWTAYDKVGWLEKHWMGQYI